MKKFGMLVVLLFVIALNTNDARTRYTSVNFNYFYYSLQPYGEWIQFDDDVVAWRPNRVNYDWSPYSIGRWVWTEYGWYWNSYERFGWATYHYGRWFYDDYYGWVWTPDYEWAPAWVEWRYDDYNIGWAPLPPYAGFDRYRGIRFSIRWRSPHMHWHFVSYNNFTNVNIYNFYINDNRVGRFFNNTKYRSDYYYSDGRIVNRGVDRRLVERRSGNRIERSELNTVRDLSRIGNVDSRVSSRTVNVYRPDEREVKKYSRNSNRTFKRAEKASLQTNRIKSGRLDVKPNANISRKNVSEVKRKTKTGISETNIRNNGGSKTVNNDRKSRSFSSSAKNVNQSRKSSVNKRTEVQRKSSSKVIRKTTKISKKSTTKSVIKGNKRSFTKQKSRTSKAAKRNKSTSRKRRSN